MLDEIYFDNTLRTWIVAAAVVLLGTVLLVLIKSLVVRRLRTLAQKTTNEIDDLIVDLLGRTRFYFFMAVSIYAASHILNKTAEVQDILRIFIVLTMLLQGGVWGNGLLSFAISRATQQAYGHRYDGRHDVVRAEFRGQSCALGTCSAAGAG